MQRNNFIAGKRTHPNVTKAGKFPRF